MATTERKMPKVYTGVVTNTSGDKTVRVMMEYKTKHPKYGKILKRRTVALVHDQDNESSEGDTVEICKCRPMSKRKSWRLVRIVSKA